MRKWMVYIGLLFSACLMASQNTIQIPLYMSEFRGSPADNPTGSTPDPTDPTQFRASLTGNTLTIETQVGEVSYVVVTETQSERNNEDYFFGLSDGVITCPITRQGHYTIYIGHWKTDFKGDIYVYDLSIWDLCGRLVQNQTIDVPALNPGSYAIYLRTTLGKTSSKIRKL